MSSQTSTSSPNQSNHSSIHSTDGTNNDAAEMTTAKKEANAHSFKLLLLLLMVLQNSSTVLVGRHTRSSVPKEELYSVQHLIFICECSKFFLSCILEHITTRGHLWASLKRDVFSNPLDALKIMVPALLYYVQNSLLYIALSNLTAPLFQVTYQAKLVTTALVSVVMLNRSYTPKQWICLVVLSVGVAIVVLAEDKGGEEKKEQSLTKGLLAVTIACLSSALAGVYFEKVLKRADATPVSLWMRNVQMAFFSVLFAALPVKGKEAATDEPQDYLHGFTAWVWVLVCLQAGGGLLVAAVIKYADNVLKGLATGVSVVVATLCSMILFKTPLTLQFTVGATLILTAVYFFSNTGAAPAKSSSSSSSGTEMKPLVLPK